MNSTIKAYLRISFICIPTGIAVGFLCFIFTYVLNFVNNLRINFPLFTIPFLCIAGVMIVYINDKFDNKEVSVKSGMKLVFTSGQGKTYHIPVVLIPLVCISTWLTNLCGGSCGREGVAVQIGATFSNIFSRFVKYKRSNEIFIIAGIGAGFSAMFQTPLAGICFALEVLTIRRIKFFAIIPTVIESIVAYYSANLLHLNIEGHNVVEYFFIDPLSKFHIEFSLILKVMFASMVFSIVGAIFSISLEKLKEIYGKKVKNKYIGIFISGILLSILFLFFHFGRYSGTGSNLISICFGEAGNSKVYWYDFILKMVLTILTLSVGFQGGEVTPLFTIGATLGYVLAKLLNIDCGFLASLGFISVFASATNTFFCPIALGIEVFGIYNTPFYILSVAVAYIINFDRSIYVQEKVKKV